MTAFTDLQQHDPQGEKRPTETAANVASPADAAEQRIGERPEGLDEPDDKEVADLDEDADMPWDDEGADDFYGDSDDD
jgi:hypothetical protein